MSESYMSRRDLLKTAGRLGVGAAFFGSLTTVAAACQAGAASPAAGAASPATGLEKFRQAGYVRTGYVYAPPYAYIDPVAGTFTGVDVEVSRAIFKKLNLPEFDPVLVSSPSYIPGLLAGRWDFTGNAIKILPDRCQNAAFFNPTHVVKEGALVAKGNPLGVESWAQLIKSSDKIRIVQGEGQQGQALLVQDGVPADKIIIVPDDSTAAEAVNSGRADVWLNDKFSLNYMATRTDLPKVEVVKSYTGRLVDGKESVVYLSVATRHSEVELLNAYNDELAKMIQSGEFLTIGQPFGVSADIIPDPSLTSKKICPDAPWDPAVKG
jgi:polar amino acid transport system substrate-binding protein